MDAIHDLERFISENADSDVMSLRLKYSRKPLPFDVDYAITQIECRRKAGSKLPFLLSHPQFRFPSVLSSEQSTSECLARFHASMIPENATVLDMTCGLGVDDYFISKRASEVLTFDIVESTAVGARENFAILGASNISVIHGDSLLWLKDNPSMRFNIIFADPARRGELNSRTYALKDCSPDIPANLDLIQRHTDRLLVKVSPMLDLTQICRELSCVSRIWVLSIKNECKELLVECDFKSEDISAPLISPINFTDSNSPADPSVIFRLSDKLPLIKIVEENPEEMIGWYIYEPDSSLMKSGGSAFVAHRLGLKKLHSNTMLYIDKELHHNFPGRVFKVKECSYLTDCLKET